MQKVIKSFYEKNRVYVQNNNLCILQDAVKLLLCSRDWVRGGWLPLSCRSALPCDKPIPGRGGCWQLRELGHCLGDPPLNNLTEKEIPRVPLICLGSVVVYSRAKKYYFSIIHLLDAWFLTLDWFSPPFALATLPSLIVSFS